jgi:Sulfotransferase family
MSASVLIGYPGPNSSGIGVPFLNSEKAAGPVVILTAARSGSTLLRFILDAHPDLACPPESGLGTACSAMARVRSVLTSTSHHDGESPREDAPVNLVDPSAAAAIRHALEGYYSDYLRSKGKVRWCEKSLDNFMYAGLIGQVFPDARFICLYRHCMDVIASGVETSPWGLRGFGFGEFAAQYSGNSVAAIAGYWYNVARAMLAFEKENPERCLRIRYEDMVAPDPDRQQHNDVHGELCGLIVGPAASWWAVLTGEANMATEILAGRLRCASSVSRTASISQEAHALAELLGLANSPMGRMPEPAAAEIV